MAAQATCGTQLPELLQRLFRRQVLGPCDATLGDRHQFELPQPGSWVVLDVGEGIGEDALTFLGGHAFQALLRRLALQEAHRFLGDLFPGLLANLLAIDPHAFGGHFASIVGPSKQNRFVSANQTRQVEGALGLAHGQKLRLE